MTGAIVVGTITATTMAVVMITIVTGTGIVMAVTTGTVGVANRDC